MTLLNCIFNVVFHDNLVITNLFSNLDKLIIIIILINIKLTITLNTLYSYILEMTQIIMNRYQIIKSIKNNPFYSNESGEFELSNLSIL